MRRRVVKDRGRYYPEIRIWFRWERIGRPLLGRPPVSFETLDEAVDWHKPAESPQVVWEKGQA